VTSDLLALAALVVPTALGIACHEGLHGLALRVLGYPHSYHVGVSPAVSDTPFRFLFVGAYVSYEPWRVEPTGREVAAVGLAPLAMFAPFLLVPLGVVPSPLWILEASSATASPAQIAALMWAATGLLSGQDLLVAVHGLRKWDAELAGFRDSCRRHAAFEGVA